MRCFPLRLHRGWLVTPPPSTSHLSRPSEHFDRELPQWIVRGWLVTPPPPCPRLRAFHPRIPGDPAPRVARDVTAGPARPSAQSPLSGPSFRVRQRGVCFDAHVRPRGSRARFAAAVAVRASRADSGDTRPRRRRAGSAWHSERDETSSDIPCSADVHPYDGASAALGADPLASTSPARPWGRCDRHSSRVLETRRSIPPPHRPHTDCADERSVVQPSG